MKCVKELIDSEAEVDKTKLEKLNWIYKNTHAKINQPLPLIELAVFRNFDKGLSREVEIGKQTFPLSTLYQYLDEVNMELCDIVISIAKKYTMDMPFINTFGSRSINLTS